MAFDPLPDPLMTHLQALSVQPSAVVVDLGCGDGALARLLHPFGMPVWGLDRVSPRAGSSADLVGDAAQPPLKAGSVDLLLAGNVLRHVAGQLGTWDFVAAWGRLLKPSGRLFILEDEPGGGTRAQAHYRRVQDLLSRLALGRRTPLVALSDARQRLTAAAPGVVWRFGKMKNRVPADPQAVLAFLEAGQVEAGGEVEALCEDIRRDGLSYGNFWYGAAEIEDGQS